MSKRYYWLKLKENFFKQKSIKKLRKIAGGDTYTIIYLKLMLLSMKTDGCVYFEGIEDNFEEELALELDEQADNVRVTLNYLESHGLLEVGDPNSFTLPETLACIGSESESAERVRRFRERKALQGNGVALLGNGAVTDCNTEIEIELDLEVEKEEDKKTPAPVPYKEIVDILNKYTGKSYKHTTKSTQEKIKARWQEGFKVPEFTQVIKKKTDQWKDDEVMQAYLRPETLFGTKFEGYLNEQVKSKQPKKVYS